MHVIHFSILFNIYFASIFNLISFIFIIFFNIHEKE